MPNQECEQRSSKVKKNKKPKKGKSHCSQTLSSCEGLADPRGLSCISEKPCTRGSTGLSNTESKRSFLLSQNQLVVTRTVASGWWSLAKCLDNVPLKMHLGSYRATARSPSSAREETMDSMAPGPSALPDWAPQQQEGGLPTAAEQWPAPCNWTPIPQLVSSAYSILEICLCQLKILISAIWKSQNIWYLFQAAAVWGPRCGTG